jgi:glutamate racemase
VEQIENELIDEPETEALVRKYVEPLLAQGVDTFVMGCTHYAFLVPIIRRVAGESVQIVETQNAVAEQVGKRLGASDLLGAGEGSLVML